MTKPGLQLNKSELNIILRNKFLFNWYVKMLIEDDEKDFEKVKYLSFFQNPELYREIENKIEFDKQIKNKNIIGQLYTDGLEATKEINKLGIFKQENEGIDEIE